MAEVTPKQIEHLKFDLPMVHDSLFDTEAIQSLYDRAESVYGTDVKSIENYVRLLILRRAKMEAVKGVDYTQGQTREQLSQMKDHLDEEYLQYEKALDSSTKEFKKPVSSVGFGSLRKRPSAEDNSIPTAGYLADDWEDLTRFIR